MSSDKLHEAINAVIIDQTWVTYERVGQDAVVAGSGLAANAILALPEMQAMLAKDAEVDRLRAERDAEIASLRKQIKVLNAWGATKTCSTCIAWDVFPADEQSYPTEEWGLCRAGLHDTTSDHFCADWEACHER